MTCDDVHVQRLHFLGQVREVEVEAYDLAEATEVQIQGGRTAGFTARTSIGRHDFGLVWNTALEAGGVAVSDEIKIEIDVELLGPAASPPEPKSKPAKPVLVAAA